MLDSLTTQKLAIAQQLLGRSLTLASESGSFAPAMAISAAQDALEFILRAAIDHHSITTHKTASFDQLIAALVKAGHRVPHQARLLQLNSARVNFKHLANLPNADQARDLVRFAQTAADDLCKQCLAVSLWQVSSVSLVLRTRVRNHLTQARDHLENGRYEESCTSSGLAFALTFGGVSHRGRGGYRHKLGHHTEATANHGYFHGGTSRDISGELSRQTQMLGGAVIKDMDEVEDRFEAFQQQIELLKVGASLDGLRRFEEIVPTIECHNNIPWISERPRIDQYTSDQAVFAFDFALDSIVKGQPAIPEPSASAIVAVVERSSPLFAWVRKDRREELTSASPGEIFPRPRHPHDRDALLQIEFEGEPAYIAAGDVTLRPTAAQTS